MSREREVGVGMGRGDGERGNRGEKGMKVVWRREMEVEREASGEEGEATTIVLCAVRVQYMMSMNTRHTIQWLIKYRTFHP